MYAVALSLGFMGSLHCIGMCGPLALGAFSKEIQHISQSLIKGLIYLTGKSISYGIIGFLAGIVGNMIFMAGIQKGISIVSGVVLLAIALFSVQPDIWLQNSTIIKHWNTILSKHLHKAYQSTNFAKQIYLGFLNGFLPCGLVYIALAGAITLQHPLGSAGFMVIFGMGTMPSLLLVILTGQSINQRIRHQIQKIYPITAALTGLYLIYRGIFSELPLQLDFIHALQHPIMCHE